MQANLTFEQILSLAADKSAARFTRNWAIQEKWVTLGQQEGVIWGCFKGSTKKPIEAMVSSEHSVFTCTCSSRKLPCNHALSLRLLYADRPDLFDVQYSSSAYAWQKSLNTRLATEPSLSLNEVEILKTRLKSSSSEPIQQKRAKQDTFQQESDHKRLQTIRAGLNELDLWLGDLVRSGLATLRTRHKNEWQRVAKRLADAHASELTPIIHQLSTIPDSSPDWPERLLAQAGRLHLLVEGFRRFETLSPEVQGDLRMAVGWMPRVDLSPDDLKHGALLHDRWHLLGREVETIGKQRRQRLWLWGEVCNRPAQVVRMVYEKQRLMREFAPGSLLNATIYFYPSQVPQRGELLHLQHVEQPTQPIPGYTSLEDTLQQVNQTLAKNPWQPRFPILIPHARVSKEGEAWYLFDPSMIRLPLPDKFEYGWHLRSLDRGRGVPLFGIWDRERFQPFSAWQNGRWLSLHILKGQK
ncbi:MAG: hypothetical protein AAF702_33480 [Chloroflexota bacterium]